jgi:esterase/lipase superfamily enzyme
MAHLSLRIIVGCMSLACNASWLAAQDSPHFTVSAKTHSDAALEPAFTAPAQASELAHTYVYFITNRRIEFDLTPGPKRWKHPNDAFTNRQAPFVIYGRTTVSYRQDRERGDAAFTESSHRNYSKYFTVGEYEFFDSRASLFAQRDILSPGRFDNVLFYVHGYNNSFSDAAERLAFLHLDLRNKGKLPLLFSWPSDPKFEITNPDTYKTARATSKDTNSLLAFTLSDLFNIPMRITLISHSMGSYLLLNSLPIKEPEITSGLSDQPGYVSSYIFAASDTPLHEFATNSLPQLSINGNVTIFCSDDRALRAAALHDGVQPDTRLGYCDKPRRPLAGADLVRVTGKIREFAKHSYFLNYLKMLDEMEGTIERFRHRPPGKNIPLVEGTYRELELP